MEGLGWVSMVRWRKWESTRWSVVPITLRSDELFLFDLNPINAYIREAKLCLYPVSKRIAVFIQNCVICCRVDLTCRVFHIKCPIKEFPIRTGLWYTLLEVLIPSYKFRHCRVIHYFMYRTTRLQIPAAVSDKACYVTTLQIAIHTFMIRRQKSHLSCLIFLVYGPIGKIKQYYYWQTKFKIQNRPKVEK